jgi:hypothetical protein
VLNRAGAGAGAARGGGRRCGARGRAQVRCAGAGAGAGAARGGSGRAPGFGRAAGSWSDLTRDCSPGARRRLPRCSPAGRKRLRYGLPGLRSISRADGFVRLSTIIRDFRPKPPSRGDNARGANARGGGAPAPRPRPRPNRRPRRGPPLLRGSRAGPGEQLASAIFTPPERPPASPTIRDFRTNPR